jgi:hypothetical protein
MGLLPADASAGNSTDGTHLVPDGVQLARAVFQNQLSHDFAAAGDQIFVTPDTRVKSFRRAHHPWSCRDRRRSTFKPSMAHRGTFRRPDTSNEHDTHIEGEP